MLLIAQIMMILNEDKKTILAGYIIVKAAGCLEIMQQTILVLGLTPSDSDCLQHNFLAAVL